MAGGDDLVLGLVPPRRILSILLVGCTERMSGHRKLNSNYAKILSHHLEPRNCSQRILNLESRAATLLNRAINIPNPTIRKV